MRTHRVRATPVTPLRWQREVRRLREPDRQATLALLRAESGASLFLRAHLETLGLRTDLVRFWGLFDAGHLVAVLMMVDQRAALYAPPGVDVRRLAEVAGARGMDLTMARADLVDALLAATPTLTVERREEHLLAELAPGCLPADAGARPAGVVVRRAEPADLGAITRLYSGADGFEQMTPDQIQRVVAGRISVLRTAIALVGDQVVAAASTSAEASDAAMIGGVWTAPAWRNRGISTAVVAALSRDLLAGGRTPFLFYLHDNAPAARVYAKLGFRTVGHWTVVYFEGRETA